MRARTRVLQEESAALKRLASPEAMIRGASGEAAGLATEPGELQDSPEDDEPQQQQQVELASQVWDDGLPAWVRPLPNIPRLVSNDCLFWGVFQGDIARNTYLMHLGFGRGSQGLVVHVLVVLGGFD